MALTSVKSGYNAKLKIDGSAVAVMTDIRVEMSQDFIETQGLADDMIQRVPGLSDWRISGTRRYASMAFLNAMSVASSANTSIGVTIVNPAATGIAVFSSVGFITRAALNYPTDATNEEIEVISKGTRPVVVAD